LLGQPEKACGWFAEGRRGEPPYKTCFMVKKKIICLFVVRGCLAVCMQASEPDGVRYFMKIIIYVMTLKITPAHSRIRSSGPTDLIGFWDFVITLPKLIPKT
jgi:hypothetical protein